MSPFKSQDQRAYFYKFLPELAQQWEDVTPKSKKLPKKVKKNGKKANDNKRKK